MLVLNFQPGEQLMQRPDQKSCLTSLKRKRKTKLKRLFFTCKPPRCAKVHVVAKYFMQEGKFLKNTRKQTAVHTKLRQHNLSQPVFIKDVPAPLTS